MATHASTLAWKIPWTEEPGRLGRLQSMGSQRVGHELSDFAFTFYGITATSSKRTYTIMLHLPRFLLLVTLTPSQATVDPGFRQRLPDTHRRVRLSLLGGQCSCSWVLVHTRFCLCPPRVCVFPVLGKFCNKILLTFKVRFPGDSQSFYQIVRLGRLLWGLKLSHQLENFFDIICGLLTWQLCSGANVNLEDLSHMPRLPGLWQPEPLSPEGVTADLCLRRRPSNT